MLAIEGDSYRGHDGTREWWKDLLGVFPDFMIDIMWVRDAGDLTVSELRNSAQGEGCASPSKSSCGRYRSGAMDGSFGGRFMKANKTPSKLPGLTE